MSLNNLERTKKKKHEEADNFKKTDCNVNTMEIRYVVKSSDNLLLLIQSKIVIQICFYIICSPNSAVMVVFTLFPVDLPLL